MGRKKLKTKKKLIEFLDWELKQLSRPADKFPETPLHDLSMLVSPDPMV